MLNVTIKPIIVSVFMLISRIIIFSIMGLIIMAFIIMILRITTLCIIVQI
jgi:hypothetical protein